MTGKSILGIDLRVTSVKVVEVEKTREGRVTVKNWGLTQIPSILVDQHPKKEDTQAEILTGLIKSRHIQAKEAVVVIGGSDVFVRLFTLTEVSRSEAADVIKWKFAEELPFPVEEALIDFYPVKEAPDKVEYVAACINQKLYREVQYIMNKAGLRLLGITVVPEALRKVFDKSIQAEKEKILSLIYMGKKTTNISIIRDGRLEFNRELGIGGENITLAMSGVVAADGGTVEIDREKAERIKLDYGLPIDSEKFLQAKDIPVDQLQAMVRPVLKRVQDEVMRTFEYYRGQSGEATVDKIILTGGGALTPSLPEFLSEGLGIPVIVEKIIERSAFSEDLIDPQALEQVMPQLSAALGAALAGPEGLNLMPEEIKQFWKIWSLKIMRPEYLVPSFAGLLLLIYLIFWARALTLSAEIRGIQKELAAIQPRVIVLDIIERTAAEEVQKKMLVRLYAEKRSKMPRVFEELSALIPQGVVLTSLNLKPAELHLFGTAYGKTDAAENILSQFVLSLSSSPYFDDVKLLEATKNNAYDAKAFNFEIIAKLKFGK